MIDLETAIKLAFEYQLGRYAKHNAEKVEKRTGYPRPLPDIAVDQANAIETPWAWVLQWNSRRWVEDGDPMAVIDGCQPLVVLKRDGTVMSLPPIIDREHVRMSIGPTSMLEERIGALGKKLGEVP